MEEFEKLVAESFQNELLPLSENRCGSCFAPAPSEPQVESEPEASQPEKETGSAESHAAGENDPAA